MESEEVGKKVRANEKNNADQKRYMCEICDKKFRLQHHYKHHMRVHTGERPYECTICDYKCKQKQQLRTHMRVHTNEKPFKCQICDYECTQKGTLTNHMKIHTGVKPFKCMFCDYRCSHKQHLQMHLRIHLGEKPFECHICGYKTSRKESLTAHIKTHTGKTPFSCEFCDLKFYHKKKLLRHLEMHSEEQELKRRETKEMTKKSRRRLKKPEEILESPVIEETKDDSCDIPEFQDELVNVKQNESFENQVSKSKSCKRCVENITNEESDEEVLACKICEEEFRDEEKMREHLRFHIEDVLNLKTTKSFESAVYNCLSVRKDENQYSREICTKKFVDGQNLQDDILTRSNQMENSLCHKNEELINCDLCDLTFYHKSDLNNHLDKDHRYNDTEEFNYFNNEVSRKSKLHLTREEQHLGIDFLVRETDLEKSDLILACKICEEEFSDEEYLSNHFKTHETRNRCLRSSVCSRKDKLHTQHLSKRHEKQLYMCSICNKKFSHKPNCQDHIRAHFNEKLYGCYLCDYTSSRKENLQSHVRTHLAEETFECPNCSYKCLHKEQLENHLKSHWLENSSVFDASSYRKDKLSSLEENPFVYHVCDMEFSREQQLYDHNKIHKREKSSKRGKWNTKFKMV